MIRRNCADTAVCFLNMPATPTDSHGEENIENYEKYVNALRLLTDGMPPTLLVYGISSVISTAL